jgi:hypothetical protein
VSEAGILHVSDTTYVSENQQRLDTL